MTIDQQEFEDFVGRFVGDFGAVLHAGTVLIGDKLGLYKAMADGDDLSPADLARRTGCDERYLAEWLAAQAASGYVTYDPATGRFRLPEVQAFALTDESGPVFLPGGFQVAGATIRDVDLMADAFRTGRGVPWGDHDAELFAGIERFFRPGYAASLVADWIPALDGTQKALDSGISVADVGCGHGASTILMADAYPASTFVGFDSHEASIVIARKAALQAGVDDRVTFEVAEAKQFHGDGYGLVMFFDCLHDMGDPVGAAAHAAGALAPDGRLLLVEPFANDRLEDNLNPVGRVFYSGSTQLCTGVSKSQEGQHALGGQAGESRLSDVLTRGGFNAVRRVAETPFNLVLEART